MNKLLYTLLATLLFSPIYSQNVSLKLFVEDAVGRKDSITFGVNDSSTLGTDISFGEINIFGTPFDSLDIRVIQRDSAHFNCIRQRQKMPASPDLYFPDNIDSKIDFRPFGYFESVNNNFEIFISAKNYPVTVKSDFKGIQGSFLGGWSHIYLLNNNCDVAFSTKIY